MKYLNVIATIALIASSGVMSQDYGGSSTPCTKSTEQTHSPSPPPPPPAETSVSSENITPASTPMNYGATPTPAPSGGHGTPPSGGYGNPPSCQSCQKPPVKCKPRPTTECTASQDSACPCIDYGAILYSMDNYSGYKVTIDGKNGDCRGLQGATNVSSIEILTGPGADYLQGRAKPEFANGVTLVFFDEFNCQGNELIQTTGHQSSVQQNVVPPKSVKFVCNGNGTTDNTPLPAGENYNLVFTTENNLGGNKSWNNGLQFQCMGISGENVGSIQFLTQNGSDPSDANNLVPNEQAAQLQVQLFTEDGCLGGKDIVVVGNNQTLCNNGVCPKPKSAMVLSVDGSMAPSTAGATGDNTTMTSQNTTDDGNTTATPEQLASSYQGAAASISPASTLLGAIMASAFYFL